MQIADARANGAKLSEISTQTGYAISTISDKLSKKPELKAYLENIQKKTIELTAQAAADNLIHLINGYKDNSCNNPKERIEKSHGFRASERIAESIGILPSRAESQVVFNILNQGNMSISKDILNIIAGLKSPVELPELGIEEGEIIDETK